MREKFHFCMTVDDIALRDWSTPGNLAGLLDFFQAEGIPAVLNVVPVDEQTDRPFHELDARYVGLIREARRAGHCIAQHGLRHNRFELGVPPPMVLDLPHEAENKRYAEEHREFFRKDHSAANCRERLRRGRAVLEDALGFRIRGFRSPALQRSPGMFRALEEEGYLFDSSCFLQKTCWDYLLDKDVPPQPITRERHDALRALSGCRIFPLTGDYTWFLRKEKYDRFMALARHDVDACLAEGLPFVTVCHVDPVFAGEGVRLLRELFAYARRRAEESGAGIEFCTLEKLAEDEAREN